MSTTHDILQLKTEAELRFFVENPAYYQAELVAAAQRELRRRGPGTPPAATPPPLPAPAAESATLGEPAPLGAPAPAARYEAPTEPTYDHAAPPAPRPWLLLGSVAAVCFVAGLGFWLKAPATASAALAQPQESAATAAPRPLETAPSAAIPTYDTQGYVEQALAQVPAAEQHNEQIVNQYRAVSSRFWAAQNPAAHLMQQAQQGQANPVFGAQARLVLGLWHDFDRTQVYSYSFGPVMADHLARMKVIAQYQRDALKELANDTEAERPPHLDDAQTLAHQQAIPGLLAPLTHKAGPITVHL